MSCPYYSFKSGLLFGGDYFCDVKKISVDSSQYNTYCRGYNYSNCVIYKSKNGSSSGCFITTVVRDILGKEDNDVLLNNFRCFRDNILHCDEKYNELLQDYDNIGPRIADAIWTDKDAVKMANGIYNISLLPINEMIKNKEYDKACEKYYLLTLSLINYYGLKHDYNFDKDNGLYEKDFDVKVSGHGRRLIKEC